YARAGVVALALIGPLACSNPAVDTAVGTTTGTSTVIVARGEGGLRVENRAGRPLLNIRLEIFGRDSPTVFNYTLPTLETGATREIPFADFHAEDGTLFEPGS